MVMHVCTLLVPKLCTTYPSTCHQMCFWRAWYVFRKGLHLICHFSILLSQKTLNGGHLWWVCLLVSACVHKPPSPHFFSFSFCCSKGFSKTKQIKKKGKKVMRLEHQTALLLLLDSNQTMEELLLQMCSEKFQEIVSLIRGLATTRLHHSATIANCLY